MNLLSLLTTEPIEHVEPIEPIKPTEPIEPIEPIETVGPIEPIEPTEPIETPEPTERRMAGNGAKNTGARVEHSAERLRGGSGGKWGRI